MEATSFLHSCTRTHTCACVHSCTCAHTDTHTRMHVCTYMSGSSGMTIWSWADISLCGDLGQHSSVLFPSTPGRLPWFFFLPIFNMQHCLLGNCQSSQESKSGRRHESLLKLQGTTKGEPSIARSPAPQLHSQTSMSRWTCAFRCQYEYERGWPRWVTSCIQSGNERNEGKSSYINVLEICHSSQRQILWAFWECQIVSILIFNTFL